MKGRPTKDTSCVSGAPFCSRFHPHSLLCLSRPIFPSVMPRTKNTSLDHHSLHDAPNGHFLIPVILKLWTAPTQEKHFTSLSSAHIHLCTCYSEQYLPLILQDPIPPSFRQTYLNQLNCTYICSGIFPWEVPQCLYMSVGQTGNQASYRSRSGGWSC